MKNAMKDRNTDFHLKEASLNFQIAFLLLLLLLSFSLWLLLLLLPKNCSSFAPLRLSWTKTHWQLTSASELIVRGQPLPSFSSGFGSRLGRVIKSVASSYTTHLETNQVCSSTVIEGGGRILETSKRRTLRSYVNVESTVWLHVIQNAPN